MRTGGETAVAVVDGGEDGADLAAQLEAGGILAESPGHANVLVVRFSRFRADEAAIVRELRAQHPGAAVLVVSGFADVARVRRALSAGATGVIAEADVERGLQTAVQAVASGLTCLPSFYRQLAGRPTFTTREKQILGMVVMGLSNGEISRRLFLAESTIKSHLSSAFTKLGVRSRNEATAMILDPANGLGPGILRVSHA